MLVRPVRLDDAEAIAVIYAPIVRESVISFELEIPDAAEMTRRIEAVTAGHPWLVAEDHGAVVAYAYATTWRARAAYAHTCEAALYVGEGRRRQGLGRLLMDELLPELKRRGFRSVIAGSTLPNPGSAAILESLGFEPAGTFREVGRKHDRWLDVGFWQLALADD